MGFADQQLQIQVPYSPDDTFNALKAAMEKLPKVKVESIVSDETYENIIDQIIEEINTGVYGDGKIFVYEVSDAIRIRTGEHGPAAV